MLVQPEMGSVKPGRSLPLQGFLLPLQSHLLPPGLIPGLPPLCLSRHVSDKEESSLQFRGCALALGAAPASRSHWGEEKLEPRQPKSNPLECPGWICPAPTPGLGPVGISCRSPLGNDSGQRSRPGWGRIWDPRSLSGDLWHLPGPTPFPHPSPCPRGCRALPARPPGMRHLGCSPALLQRAWKLLQGFPWAQLGPGVAGEAEGSGWSCARGWQALGTLRGSLSPGTWLLRVTQTSGSLLRN